jgi:ribosomal-protein-alanine N-acetyltransferase
VVELEGRVIGHGILSMGAGEAHILNLCVQAEYRCLGVGRRLLTLLIDIARGAGMTDAFLEVRPTNTAAIRLYLAMGFEQVGVRRGYYQAVNGREDAAVLRLPLVSD